MGSSFIKYRGFGFWSADELIEAVAGEVVRQFRHTGEAWRDELSAHGTLIAEGYSGGWVHLNLDEFLTTEERRLDLRGAILAVARQHGVGDPVRETAEFLIELLDGRLKMDASHSLYYMVGRPRGEGD